MFEIGDTVRVICTGRRLALALIVGIATLTAGQGIDYSEHGTMTVDVSKADNSLRYVLFHEPTDPQISYTAICRRTHADYRKLDAGKDYDFQILPPSDPTRTKMVASSVRSNSASASTGQTGERISARFMRF